jgi:hypothetical protein
MPIRWWSGVIEPCGKSGSGKGENVPWYRLIDGSFPTEALDAGKLAICSITLPPMLVTERGLNMLAHATNKCLKRMSSKTPLAWMFSCKRKRVYPSTDQERCDLRFFTYGSCPASSLSTRSCSSKLVRRELIDLPKRSGRPTTYLVVVPTRYRRSEDYRWTSVP